MSLSAANTGTL